MGPTPTLEMARTYGLRPRGKFGGLLLSMGGRKMFSYCLIFLQSPPLRIINEESLRFLNNRARESRFL